MKQGEQNGFTIIETMLFLAISGMLLLVAFTFTRASIENARSSDAVKSLEAFVKDQYTKVQTGALSLAALTTEEPTCAASGGIASTPAVAYNVGHSDTCILLGSVLDFETASTLTVYPVLGYAKADVDGKNVTDALLASNPQVWSAAPADVFAAPWQSQMNTRTSVFVRDPVPGRIQPFARLIILRGVKSETINVYVSSTTAATVSSVIQAVKDEELMSAATSNVRNVPALICLNFPGSNLRGAVILDSTSAEKSFNVTQISSRLAPSTTSYLTGAVPLDGSYTGMTCP